MRHPRTWPGRARPRGTGLRGDAPRSRTRPSAARGRRDRGQVALEYLGFLPVLLLVGLAGLQLGLASYAAQQAGTAARAAARAESDDDGTTSGEAAARAATSGWLDVTGGSPETGDGQVTTTVTVEVPRVVPFWSFDPVIRTATMPLPATPEEGP
ncbi:TadE/TadG family type IV pilus assembly protein [Streptomyces griseus]|uniref:TadE/TadG family type IV pilus assembly protein n=1 Tax=Streptomyces griseus TaxID=1911 RepID=UPI000AE58B35|nr:TadE/TadG family type IV pilus assembly protein [Streptomyces griseus]